MVFGGELAKRDAASRQKLRAISRPQLGEIEESTASNHVLCSRKPEYLFQSDHVYKIVRLIVIIITECLEEVVAGGGIFLGGGGVLKNKGTEKQEHVVQKGWGAGEGERMLQLEAGIELIPN